MNAVQAQIEGEVNALQSALGRRKQIRAAREKLELMQEAVHLEGKVEGPTGIVLCSCNPACEGDWIENSS